MILTFLSAYLFCLLWFRGKKRRHLWFSSFNVSWEYSFPSSFLKSKMTNRLSHNIEFFLELPFRVDHYLYFELMQMRYSVCLNLPSSSWFFFLFFSNKAFDACYMLIGTKALGQTRLLDPIKSSKKKVTSHLFSLF